MIPDGLSVYDSLATYGHSDVTTGTARLENNLTRGFFLLSNTLLSMPEVDAVFMSTETPPIAMSDFQLRKVDYQMCDVTHCTPDTRARRTNSAPTGERGEVWCEGSESLK